MSDTELKKTPLADSHRSLGARMVPYAGFQMPIQYSGIIEEHNATRNAAGIFDVSHMAQFRVSGAGQQVFLQRMLTNDIALIEETGSAQYTLMLNDEGGIIDDLIVYNTGNEYLVIANASNHQKDFDWLMAHKPDDVELVDESDRTALIALQGPESARIMGELTDDDYELPKRFHLNAAIIDGSVPVLVARTGYTGEDGVELISRTDDALALWGILLSFPEVTPVGLGARDTLRLEKGYHLYGNDMDETRNPIEANLGWVCPAEKDGYIGVEAVRKARIEGVSEKLAHLRVEGQIPRSGQKVFLEGESVGVVGSGSHSPTFGFGMATAYLPRELAVPGSVVQIEIRRKLVNAIVVKPPFGL
jgi:aminomethyltransferase